MAERESKRDVIKQQAMRLFAQHGIDAVSVRDIADACDMAKPNLYAHFPSMEALITELFEEGYREYGCQMSGIAEGEGDFRSRLERLVRLICRLHDSDNIRFRFILMTHHSALGKVTLGEMNPVEIVVRMVSRAMEAGEIPRRNAELVAAAIVGLVIQPATFVLYGRIGKDLKSSTSEIVAMCQKVVS
jgi:AcrR family transcriptional regulator